MHRHAFGIAVVLCCALTPATGSSAPPSRAATAAASITYAEQAVRLLRDTSVASAVRGAALLSNDLIETGAGTVQLQTAGATIALGPATRLYIRSGADLVLLAGWMKVAVPAGGSALMVASANLQFGGAGATVTVHAVPGTSDLFVESGDIAVAELAGGKAGRQLKLAREQYAVRSGAAPLKSMPRPPKEFIADMPPAFLDPLVALAFKGPAPALKIERAASVADYAPLLAEHPALRQQVARRFEPPPRPALKNPPSVHPLLPAAGARIPNDVY